MKPKKRLAKAEKKAGLLKVSSVLKIKEKQLKN